MQHPDLDPETGTFAKKIDDALALLAVNYPKGLDIRGGYIESIFGAEHYSLDNLSIVLVCLDILEHG